MNRIKYSVVLALSLFFWGGCSKNDMHYEDDGERVEIGLSGAATRNAAGNNIYLYGFFTQGHLGSLVDFSNEYTNLQVLVDGGLTDQEKDIKPKAGTKYYPFGNKPIRLFACTGAANKSGGEYYMSLNAGYTASEDAVLSNYGRAYTDATPLPPNTAYEGMGTPGSSKAPARMLQFRHVMTQLNVAIELLASDPPTTTPSSVQFTIEDVIQKGNYRIAAKDPRHVSPPETPEMASTVNTSLFTIKKGMNYLVPTGVDLSGKALKSLKIDDYTATAEDLLAFVINPDTDSPNPGSSFELYPGYAYKLTFKIGRLGLQGIKLEQVDWVKQEIKDPGISFEPKVLAMTLGDYDGTTTEAVKNRDNVERVVLHTNENNEPRQYTGEAKIVNGEVEVHFVKLPPSHTDVELISIHTPKGLLLHFPHDPSNPAEYDPFTKTISLDLSRGGMRPMKPGNPMTADNPYLITTPLQFINIQKDLDALAGNDIFLKQVADVDFDLLNLIGHERYFIGFDEFRGVYDGGRHYIAGIDLEAPGLFEINRGTIKNLHLVTGVIKAFKSGYDNNGVDGKEYAGSICAVNRGTIIGCINEVRINNSETDADGNLIACMEGSIGGICGVNDVEGRVIACLNSGTIRHGVENGGIVGRNLNPLPGAVVACVNIGDIGHHVDKNPCVGGIAGSSVPAQDPQDYLFNTCYWLVGTAQEKPGQAEVAVGGQYLFNQVAGDFPLTSLYGCDDLDPNEMRSDEIRNKLNGVLNDASVTGTDWSGRYEFKLLPNETGTTWPTPIQK